MADRKKCEAIHNVTASIVCPECGISANIESIIWLRNKVDEMKAFIKSLEWAVRGPDKWQECPSCRALQPNGHLKDCKLKVLLTGVK